MAKKKSGISQLALLFADLGVQRAKPLPDFYTATETLPNDPREMAGIQHLDRQQPAALFTFITPIFNSQGMAVDERRDSVCFNVVPTGEDSAFDIYTKTRVKFEEAFMADARQMGVTATTPLSQFFPAEPPPAGASLRDRLPSAAAVDTSGLPIGKRIPKEREIVFDPAASFTPREPAGPMPADKVIKAALGSAGLH